MDRDQYRAHADLDTTHWWFVGRRRIIEAVLRRWVEPGDRVLDVGCGAGGLLSSLAPWGRVRAIEGDEQAAELAAERNPDAIVRRGDLPAALSDEDPADLVTAFDVIEHLEDDLRCLRDLRKLLTPGGSLCVTVPAGPWLWSSHDDANGHYRRYTARTLRTALEQAGFRVRHLSYFNLFLLPLVAAARLLERLRGPSGGGDLDRSLGPLDGILRSVLSSERYLVPRIRLPLGVSLIAVATAEPGERT